MFSRRPLRRAPSLATHICSRLATRAGAKGLACGRATRALGNYVENYGPFIAMALALIATGQAGGLGAAGATIWILARIVYLPIYLMGVIYVRTGLWAISVIGLLMMLYRLVV